jgi:uncharacterized protein
MITSSSLYRCTVFHGRVHPVDHLFRYNYFLFFIDLDELDTIACSSKLVSVEKAAMYSFRSKDHFNIEGCNTKTSILNYLQDKEIDTTDCKLYLLTNLRTAGHQFNPVSFYFLSKQDKIISCIAEVGNTFGEQKLYLIPQRNDHFYLKTPKHFYVSPFSDLKAEFEFIIKSVEEKLDIRVNTLENGKPVLYSRLEGSRTEFNDRTLLNYTFRFPLVTLKVISGIHFQALKLWLKKTPFIRKKDDPELQNDHYRIL